MASNNPDVHQQEPEIGSNADPVIPYIPRVPLTVIVLVHFTLTVFACQAMAGTMWISYSYAYTNFFVIAMGCWAIGQFQPPSACFMFLVSMLISIVIDLELMIVYYPRAEDIVKALYPSMYSELTFCLVMACFNIILKVPSSLCIYNHLKLRGGIFIMGFLANSGFVTSAPQARQYNDPELGTGQTTADVTIETPSGNLDNPVYNQGNR